MQFLRSVALRTRTFPLVLEKLVTRVTDIVARPLSGLGRATVSRVDFARELAQASALASWARVTPGAFKGMVLGMRSSVQ